LTLGDSSTNAGLKIVDSTFSVQDVSWTISGIVLGPVTINKLAISYKVDGPSYDLNVGVNVSLPGNFSVDGEFGVLKGKFDSINIDISPPAGELEIPGTGLSIIDLHVKVTNISNPSAIVVVGSMAVVWGEQIPMLGQSVYLFRAEGDITA